MALMNCNFLMLSADWILNMLFLYRWAVSKSIRLVCETGVFGAVFFEKLQLDTRGIDTGIQVQLDLGSSGLYKKFPTSLR